MPIKSRKLNVFFRFSMQFSMFRFLLAFTVAHTIPNYYKHSMSNGIRVQLVMRFSSKRMCVVCTQWSFIYSTIFRFYASRQKLFTKSLKEEAKKTILFCWIFDIFFFFCWMFYKFTQNYTLHKQKSSRGIAMAMALVGFLYFAPPANKLNKNKREDDTQNLNCI